MRAAVAADTNYPRVLFVYMGAPADGAGFFAGYWPEAQALADAPPLPLYRGFGLKQGGAAQMMDFGLVTCTLRAVAKGNLPGRPVGDPLQMPGLFLVRGAQVLWQRDYAHAGDSPDWRALPAQLGALLCQTEAIRFDNARGE